MFDQFGPALETLFSAHNLIYLFIGALIGMAVGILPGLGGAAAIALLLPLTLPMEPATAIIMFIGIVGANPTASSLTAIMINLPGSGQSAATVIDGFKMTQQGRAGVAIGAAMSSSFLGALVGVVILIALLPLGQEVVLLFSYPEYFMLAIMGLSAIAVVSEGPIWKGVIAAVLGLALSSVGYDPITGDVRYTFGSDYLYDGISLVPALIGLFAISETINMFVKGGSISEVDSGRGTISGIGEGIISVFKHPALFMRSSIIGTIVGIIPGVGGSVANWLAYGQAVQTARDPEKFGTGDVRGVIAPEAANNAKDGGALVPTLIFGIPGSSEFAILLGALTIHGIQPGPRLLMDNPHEVVVLILALTSSALIAGVAGLFAGGIVSPILRVRTTYIAPAIIAISLFGAYASDLRFGDVIIAFVFGILGFFMRRYGFSLVALVLALILGSLIQTNFHQTMTLFGPAGFFTNPIALGLFITTVLLLLVPYLRSRRAERRSR